MSERQSPPKFSRDESLRNGDAEHRAVIQGAGIRTHKP